MTQPPVTDDIPGRQQLSGYVMRDYDELIARLASSRESQHVTTVRLAAHINDHEPNISRTLRGHTEARGRRLFMLAHALGYDLALVPREPDSAGTADPNCVWPNGVCTCGEPEGHRDPETREDA